MGTAIAKQADNPDLAVPRIGRCAARVTDAMHDGVVVRVHVTPELIGHMVTGQVSHFDVAIIGQEWLAALYDSPGFTRPELAQDPEDLEDLEGLDDQKVAV